MHTGPHLQLPRTPSLRVSAGPLKSVSQRMMLRLAVVQRFPAAGRPVCGRRRRLRLTGTRLHGHLQHVPIVTQQRQ